MPDSETSFIIEIERPSSRPSYASFKTAGPGEIAFDNAKAQPGVVRVRLLRVEGSRQTPIMEYVAPVAARPTARAPVPAGKATKPASSGKWLSTAITSVLILIVLYFAARHSFSR